MQPYVWILPGAILIFRKSLRIKLLDVIFPGSGRRRRTRPCPVGGGAASVDVQKFVREFVGDAAEVRERVVGERRRRL